MSKREWKPGDVAMVSIVRREGSDDPAEPTGLGAVVEDADGERWVRSHPGDTPWTRPHLSGTYAYSSIAAVRVLSEGVHL